MLPRAAGRITSFAPSFRGTADPTAFDSEAEERVREDPLGPGGPPYLSILRAASKSSTVRLTPKRPSANNLRRCIQVSARPLNARAWSARLHSCSGLDYASRH